MKILFYVERGLYECIKIYFNINFLYNHPKASKRPLIAVPIIMNNPVVEIGASICVEKWPNGWMDTKT